MKLNKIFMALAAMAIVGCSSEDVSDFTAKQATNEDSRLVELNPNFVLAGVGEEGNITRTHWEQDAETGALVNKFLPIYEVNPADGDYLDVIPGGGVADLEAQAVGLCWLGQGAVGTNVYTNYQFFHYGWLKKGETKADADNCEPFTLYNGATYNEIELSGITSEVAGDEADETTFVLPNTPIDKSTWELNWNSGVYKTDNKSIFGGDYIVYYPFNKEFQEVGTIPAEATTSFEWNPAVIVDPWENPMLGRTTFRYSDPVHIDGGDQAANFALHNLSTLVRLRVFAATAADVESGDQVDQIVLYSPSEQFFKKVNLAADKIVAGKKGAELYVSEECEGTKTITTKFTTPANFGVKASTKVSAYLTVLPTTVDDLVVLVHKVNGSDGKWARVTMPTTEFKAGAAKVLDVSVKNDDYTSDFIAVDEASLTTALTEARNEVSSDPTAKPTIEVIGDITLVGSGTPKVYEIKDPSYDANITITGGTIIVPQDVTLRLRFINMESDIRVLGKSCCDGLLGGRLTVYGGTPDGKVLTRLNNITLEETKARTDATTYEDYNPQVVFSSATKGKSTIAAGKTFDVQAGTVKVDHAVEHKASLNIAEGAKLTVIEPSSATNKGDLQFMCDGDKTKIVNNGTIEVEKDAKFDITDKNGNATAIYGKNMTNNGTFIHKVDAGVGTTVQNMNQNGEYRCKVNDQVKLDDAYKTWTACNVIEMVDAGVSYDLKNACQHKVKGVNKHINIEVNTTGTTTFINPGDGDENIINIGDLTVTKGGLDIDFAGVKKLRTLTVNGNMTVADDVDINTSKKIAITGNLTVEDGADLTYAGGHFAAGVLNNGELTVTGDITVSGSDFIAGTGTDVDALNITCANFYLKEVDGVGATATFGNRTDGGAWNMKVGKTISNPEGCAFIIEAANQDGAGSVMAQITCKELLVGGVWDAARPQVIE